MRNLPAVGLLFVLAIPVLALAQSDFESASTDMRHNSVASDVTSIRLSIPKPTSEMLPASGKLEIRYRGRKIAWKEIPALPERPLVEKVRERLRPPPPSANHPWRRDYRDMRAQWYTTQW
jgi:hypothetical protein